LNKLYKSVMAGLVLGILLMTIQIQYYYINEQCNPEPQPHIMGMEYNRSDHVEERLRQVADPLQTSETQSE